MGKFLIILLFLIGSGCAHSQKNDELAELHLRTGAALLEQGRHPQALAELLTAHEYNPRNPVIHNYLGLAYFFREQLARAEQHLTRAIELHPGYSEARNNLSRILSEQEKYQEAIHHAGIVLEDLTYQNPEKAHINKGIALFHSTLYEAARDSFQNALNLHRNSCLARSYYGRSLYELEQFDRATQALDAAVSVCRERNYGPPHYFSALSFYKNGDTSRARARLAEVIEFYPDGQYRENAKELLNVIR